MSELINRSVRYGASLVALYGATLGLTYLTKDSVNHQKQARLVPAHVEASSGNNVLGESAKLAAELDAGAIGAVLFLAIGLGGPVGENEFIAGDGDM